MPATWARAGMRPIPGTKSHATTMESDLPQREKTWNMNLGRVPLEKDFGFNSERPRGGRLKLIASGDIFLFESNDGPWRGSAWALQRGPVI